MKKEDSIRQYIDKYLEKRSPQAKEEFLKKSIDRQYAAIMAWRYRQLKKSSAEENSSEAVEIINLLKGARKKLALFPDLTDSDLKAISLAKEEFDDTLRVFKLHLTDKKIAELEQQQLEIARRLESLRNKKN